jgi:cell division protein FtsA
LQDVIRNPIYSTAVGLLLFGNDNRTAKMISAFNADKRGILARMKSWFQGNF